MVNAHNLGRNCHSRKPCPRCRECSRWQGCGRRRWVGNRPRTACKYAWRRKEPKIRPYALPFGTPRPRAGGGIPKSHPSGQRRWLRPSSPIAAACAARPRSEEVKGRWSHALPSVPRGPYRSGSLITSFLPASAGGSGRAGRCVWLATAAPVGRKVLAPAANSSPTAPVAQASRADGGGVF